MATHTYLFEVIKPLADMAYVILYEKLHDVNGELFIFKNDKAVYIIIQNIDYTVLNLIIDNYKDFLKEYHRLSPDIRLDMQLL